MLLPFLAAFTAVLAKVAPQLATKLLAPCDLQHASYVLLRVHSSRFIVMICKCTAHFRSR